MAVDKKRATYEIAVEVGGEAKPSLKKTAAEAKSEISALRSAAEKSSGAMAKLVSLGRAGIAFAAGSKVVGGLADIAKSAMNAAQEMETYRTTLNTVLRDEDAAADMMRWATDFAAHTPYNTGEVVEAVTKMEAYGFKSQTMLENIGNMASAMNRDLTTAVEAVYKASIGDMELMRNNFAITKELINEKAEELYGKSVINASGAIKDAEAYNNAMLRLIEEKFSGGMERQSKTFAGIKSNIEDSWDAALRKLAGMDESGEIVEGGFMDRVKTGLSNFAAWFDDFVSGDTITEWAGKLMQAMDWLGGKLSPIVAEGVPALIDGVTTLYGDAKSLVLAVNGIVEKIYGEGIVDLLVDGVVTAMQGVSEEAHAVHNLIAETKGLIERGSEMSEQERIEAEARQRDAFVDSFLPAWFFGEGVNQAAKDILAGPTLGNGQNAETKLRIDSARTADRVAEAVENKASPSRMAGALIGSNYPTLRTFSTPSTSAPVSVEVNVTAAAGQDADELGDTIGERVAEAIQNAERQKARMQLIKEGR